MVNPHLTLKLGQGYQYIKSVKVELLKPRQLHYMSIQAYMYFTSKLYYAFCNAIGTCTLNMHSKPLASIHEQLLDVSEGFCNGGLRASL